MAPLACSLWRANPPPSITLWPRRTRARMHTHVQTNKRAPTSKQAERASARRPTNDTKQRPGTHLRKKTPTQHNKQRRGRSRTMAPVQCQGLTASPRASFRTEGLRRSCKNQVVRVRVTMFTWLSRRNSLTPHFVPSERFSSPEASLSPRLRLSRPNPTFPARTGQTHPRTKLNQP